VILVDTSAWVEFDRATDSLVDQRLRSLIADGVDIAVTEPVIAELVAGARTDAGEARLRSLLLSFDLLPFEAPIDFDGASTIYRRCRAQGVTPRGLLDCMIAAVAVRNSVPVLSHDVDLALIAKVVDLRLDEASTR
jgi:predicted nucleic acid-binding protein